MERHGFVTFWLWLIVIGNVIMVIICFSNNNFMLAVYNYNTILLKINGLMNIMNCVAAILILNWKNGFWLFLGQCIISVFINIGSGSNIIIMLVGSIIACLIFYGILNLKKNGISTWDYLTGKNSKNDKEKLLKTIGKNWKDILLENNIGEYIDIFEQNKLTDFNVIMELNESDLEKLGINIMGDRKNILKLFSYDSLLGYKISDTYNNEFETKYLKEIENEKEIIESKLFQFDYNNLLEELIMKYPVSTRRDIENIEEKHGIEIAKKIVVKMLINKNYGT